MNTSSHDEGSQSTSDTDSAQSTRDLDLSDRSDGSITGPAEMDSPEAAQIRSWAELALLNDPLNARALRILGQLSQLSSDNKHTEALMQAAVRRSIHESLAVYSMIRKSYEDGNYRAALRYADILLRTRNQTEVLLLLMPMFAKIAETPDASNELKRLLAQNPPWRWEFFRRTPP